MKVKKKGKGLATFYALVGAVAVLAGGVSSISANNWEDTRWAFHYNGDGSDVATKARDKEDNTYSYVRNDSEVTINAACGAKEGINAGDYGIPMAATYTTWYYQVGSGERKYFPNDAHEEGYSATFLITSSADHNEHYIHGYWSPDNCSGYGTP
ncbi:MAG: hypothetical protein OSJ62_15045 [Lachnospiraceae bacterium]|nr:hypothetical protein [Lachnospiraceae bacterium]